MSDRPPVVDYRDLEVWQLARELSVSVHHMTLDALPKFEWYEEGSQIRRASKSIRANIVEGFGCRRYKAEFVKHLTYAIASARETEDHLLTLRETGSLKDESLFRELSELTSKLLAKLMLFTASVQRNHRSP